MIVLLIQDGESGKTGGIMDDTIREYGQEILCRNPEENKIYLLSVIGEIEGHENLPANCKTTKYEHVLPLLANVEDDKEIDGLLLLVNSCGGDVDAGLAIAEMIAGLSKPTVSLVLGASHSISVPLAVSADFSFIVPTATMIIHPVRISGTVLGAPQTYDYFQLIQDRIIDFIVGHTSGRKERVEEMMINTGILTKDLGTILVGEQAVKEGLIDQVGGIRDAVRKLNEMISGKRNGRFCE